MAGDSINRHCVVYINPPQKKNQVPNFDHHPYLSFVNVKASISWIQLLYILDRLSKADVFCMIAQIPFWVLLTENPPLLFQKSLHDNPHALDTQHFDLQNTSNKSYIYHSHQKLLDLYNTFLLTIWTVCTLTNITSNVPETCLLGWGGGCNVEKCTQFFSSHASKHKPMSLIQHSSASLLKRIPQTIQGSHSNNLIGTIRFKNWTKIANNEKNSKP